MPRYAHHHTPAKLSPRHAVLCCASRKRSSSSSRGASGSRGVPVHCMHRPRLIRGCAESKGLCSLRANNIALLTKIACPRTSTTQQKMPLLSLSAIAQPRDGGYICFNIVIAAHGKPGRHAVTGRIAFRAPEWWSRTPAKAYSCQDKMSLGSKKFGKTHGSEAGVNHGTYGLVAMVIPRQHATVSMKYILPMKRVESQVGGGLSGRCR